MKGCQGEEEWVRRVVHEGKAGGRRGSWGVLRMRMLESGIGGVIGGFLVTNKSTGSWHGATIT